MQTTMMCALSNAIQLQVFIYRQVSQIIFWINFNSTVYNGLIKYKEHYYYIHNYSTNKRCWLFITWNLSQHAESFLDRKKTRYVFYDVR